LNRRRNRAAEIAAIDRINACGTTRCLNRFAGTVIGAFSRKQEAQRITALQIEPDLTREQRIDRLKLAMRSHFR
jgi:hypothetical protein